MIFSENFPRFQQFHVLQIPGKLILTIHEVKIRFSFKSVTATCFVIKNRASFACFYRPLTRNV